MLLWFTLWHFCVKTFNLPCPGLWKHQNFILVTTDFKFQHFNNITIWLIWNICSNYKTELKAKLHSKCVFFRFGFPRLHHDYYCQAVKQRLYHLKLKVNLLTDVFFIWVNVEPIITHFQAAIINTTFKLAQWTLVFTHPVATEHNYCSHICVQCQVTLFCCLLLVSTNFWERKRQNKNKKVCSAAVSSAKQVVCSSFYLFSFSVNSCLVLQKTML